MILYPRACLWMLLSITVYWFVWYCMQLSICMGICVSSSVWVRAFVCVYACACVNVHMYHCVSMSASHKMMREFSALEKWNQWGDNKFLFHEMTSATKKIDLRLIVIRLLSFLRRNGQMKRTEASTDDWSQDHHWPDSLEILVYTQREKWVR